MENSFINTLKSRRSCRHYQPQQITDEELNAVLEAGTWAPTAHGAQDPVIVAVQNAELRQELVALNARVRGGSADPYYGAPHWYWCLYLPTTKMDCRMAVACCKT